MVGGSGEKYLLKVAAKYADRYNLYFGSPEEMKRKINIIKEYNSQNRKIENSIVLPCLNSARTRAVEKNCEESGKANDDCSRIQKINFWRIDCRIS
jgi:hypothetical protein